MNIDKFIQELEHSVNNLIDTNYNFFYVQPYGNKYGIVFNGDLIAVAGDLRELEHMFTAFYFLLKGDIKK